MHYRFRTATEQDLPRIIELLADDVLGAQRESSCYPLDKGYTNAFCAIDTDPNNELIVLEATANSEIVGLMHLTFIPYITHRGAWRCMVESVRVAADTRGQGLGEKMLLWAKDRAEARNCKILQLTSDKKRPNAIRFYQRLGFVASHEGFKLKI